MIYLLAVIIYLSKIIIKKDSFDWNNVGMFVLYCWLFIKAVMINYMPLSGQEIKVNQLTVNAQSPHAVALPTITTDLPLIVTEA